MFCPSCGNQIADQSTFCMHCGKNIAEAVGGVQTAQPVMDFQAQKNAIRESEIKALSNAMQYFSQKKDEFYEYDLVCELVKDFSKGAKSSLLVWGCIITTVGLLCVLGSAGQSEAFLGCLIGFLVPGILMMVGGILMKVNSAKKYKYFQEEYARLSQELYEHYVSYPNCPVGPEYSNPEILEIIMSILQSGRADTIKESINLALSDAEQSEMNEYLATIEQHTNAINAQTKVAAIFAAANFFK